MKPLSKKTRVSLVSVLFLVFLVSAPALVLYSTGYRLGDALSLVKTGGIFVHSNLSGTEVYVNDDFIENNGVVLRNTLVQNLIPLKTYSVRIEKDGYHTWQKELYVRPNLVTEAGVLMLPTEIEFDEIKEFLISDTSQVATRATTTKTVLNPEYEKVNDLFLEELDQFEIEVATSTDSIKKINRSLLPGRFISATSSPKTGIETVFYASTSLPNFILDLEIEGIFEKESLREKNKTLAWLSDGDVEIAWAGAKESIPYIFCVEKCNERITVSLDTPIKRFNFFPGRDDVLLVVTERGLFAIETDNRSAPNIQPILEAPDLNFRVKDGNIIFIKKGDVFLEVLM